MSLKQTIYEYIKSQYPRVVHKGEIGRKAVLEWGYENENSGRRCRELENAGLIRKVENEKGEAQYVYAIPKDQKTFCCISDYRGLKVHDSYCKYVKKEEVRQVNTLF